jgi:hypothetical protein
MKWMPIRPTSGGRLTRLVRSGGLAVVLAVGLGACNYGFEGGGFPPHIRTIYIEPFDNQTPQFDLDQILYDRMLQELPRKLGIRVAGREFADAIVQGTISRYDDVAQAYNPAGGQAAPAVAANEVQIGISVRFIDVRDNLVRWESTRLVGRGLYDPAGETEQTAQLLAIASIIEQIIDGTQSQW